jgi:hypothetical protein
MERLSYKGKVRGFSYLGAGVKLRVLVFPGAGSMRYSLFQIEHVRDSASSFAFVASYFLPCFFAASFFLLGVRH